MSTLEVVALVAFGVAVVGTPLAIKAGRRFGVLDAPGVLKPQPGAVPRVGGTAVLAGVAAGLATGRGIVAVPVVGAVLLGLADDIWNLSPWTRLAGQACVGGGIAAAVPWRLHGVLALLVGAVAGVVVVNGVNLLDGLDGLAGAVLAVTGLWFAALLHGSGRALALSMTCALAGFLLYNRPPARVYLGDGGSYLLGALAVVLLAEAWGRAEPVGTGMAALALVALPASEVVFALVRRARARSSIVAGDRRHPYDLLVAKGWPAAAVTAAFAGAEATVGAVAWAIKGAGLPWQSIVVAGVALALVAVASSTGALSTGRKVPV